jgi:DNA-binding CsgD family transcriptional regulator
MTPQAALSEPILDEPTRRLCATIAGGGATPVRFAVVAPGGYGKSVLLDHLEDICAAAGVEVGRFARTAGITDTGLLLVDDAHGLGESDLAELERLCDDDRIGLVVAARPRPRPAGLNQVMGRLQAQIVLRPFEIPQIERALAAGTRGRVQEGLAHFVHAQTGGVPGLALRVAAAPDGLSTADGFTLPPSAVVGIRHELDRMDPGVLAFLLASEAGAGLDPGLLGGVLGQDPAGVAAVIDAARATGLCRPDGSLLPIARRALESLVPGEQWAAARQRLAALRLAGGGPLLPMVRPWLGAGLTGTDVASAFEAAAREASPDDPALAARLFDAAVTAGTPSAVVGARRAEALALSGDLETALRLADETIATAEAADRAVGAQVAATAMAHRGQLGRSAELLRWAGTAQSRPFAAVCLVATGRRAEAAQLLDGAPGDEPPTLLSGALSSVGRGVLDSVSGSPATALSTLVSAAEMLEPVGRTALLPDSPAALGALVALHCGELSIAEPLLERALAAQIGGPALVTRHRLLLAWTAMLRGDTALAGERLAAAGPVRQPRDWLFAVALEVGIARRSSDLGALRRIWGQAWEAVVRQPVDLFGILAFGEFAVAAARLGERDRLAPHLARATELLRALGDPPLWATPLHWSGLHAAIIDEHPEEARAHAEALAACADLGPYFAAVSAAAASWLKVLEGDVDADEVEAAARGLHASGLWWDGARLAGQAAIRTADRPAMLALLDCARVLQGAPGTADGTTVDDGGGPVRLSDRELQVAELVLEGLTYKQIGERLFISAKTVEHHMARMRQRLGVSGRSELLAQLRSMLS